jgi:hypothetical protein
LTAWPTTAAAHPEGAACAANSVIFEDRQITVRYGTAEEFATQAFAKRWTKRHSPCHRNCRITYSLRSTHLRHTGQLGMILPAATKFARLAR